ncbi:MAG: prepilin-type N-terminal cleavage/methylation domain-containing protein [Phycisphaerales bacterium]|jgi:prepilin-type N-terminal cleavage/methylation domain-containing protein
MNQVPIKTLSNRRPTGRCYQRGFTLLELITVMSITSLLAGLLLPALSSVRENAHRVLCGSNQRQLGQAITMYSHSRRYQIPIASVLDDEVPDPSLLSRVRTGVRYQGAKVAGGNPDRVPRPLPDSSFDGLGRLYRWHYCGEPETYYCPSHEGEHSVEECQDMWKAERINEDLHGNYHYTGHKDWRTGKRKTLLQGEKLILITDGLRTKSDYSHGVGYNVLRGDGSVAWKDDVITRTKLTALAPMSIDDLRDLDDLIYDIFSGQ